MSIETEKYDKRTEKLRLSKTSYMNNTKWVTLFNALSISDFRVKQAKIKVLACETSYPFDMHIGVSETGKHTNDGLCGPIAFKDIEWIFVPATYEISHYSGDIKFRSDSKINDIHTLKKCIDRLGFFEYECYETGLKLYGYK